MCGENHISKQWLAWWHADTILTKFSIEIAHNRLFINAAKRTIRQGINAYFTT